MQSQRTFTTLEEASPYSLSDFDEVEVERRRLQYEVESWIGGLLLVLCASLPWLQAKYFPILASVGCLLHQCPWVLTRHLSDKVDPEDEDDRITSLVQVEEQDVIEIELVVWMDVEEV